MKAHVYVVHGSRRQGHLLHCLNSLSEQTVEVPVTVLYDDTARKDPDCIRRLGVTHKHVTVKPMQYDKESYCIAAVRNGAFDNGDDVVIMLDSDCYVEPDFVEKTLAAMQGGERCIVAFSRYDIAPNGSPLQNQPNRSDEYVADLIKDGSRNALMRACLGPAYATNTHDHKFNTAFIGWGCEDAEWAYRNILDGVKVVQGPRVYHQYHEEEPNKHDDFQRNQKLLFDIIAQPKKASLIVGVTHGSDRADALSNCIDSLMMQDTDLKIVVLYDSATDHDPLVVERLQKTHPYIPVVKVEYDATNGYCVSAVRNGVFNVRAREKYVAWIDSDCIAPIDFARTIKRECGFDEKRVVVFCGQRITKDPSQGTLESPVGPGWYVNAQQGYDRTPETVEARLRANTARLMSMSVGGVIGLPFKHAPRWDERYRNWGVEDEDYGYMLWKKKVLGVAGPIVYHQEHEVYDRKWRSQSKNWEWFAKKNKLSVCLICGDFVQYNESGDSSICPTCQAECAGSSKAGTDALIGVVHGSDRKESLDYCIRSLKQQKDVTTNIVVLYDATSHRDDDVRERIAKDHPDVFVHYVNYDRSQGYCVSAVRNALLRFARWEPLIGWIDSDCIVENDFVKRMLDSLSVEPKAAFACPRLRIVPDENGSPVAGLGKWAQATTDVEPRDERMVKHWLKQKRFDHDVVAMCGPVYFAAIDVIVPFDERYKGWGWQDTDWNAGVLCNGGKAVLGPVSYHIEHEPEATKTEDNQRNWDLFHSKYPDYTENRFAQCEACGEPYCIVWKLDHLAVCKGARKR